MTDDDTLRPSPLDSVPGVRAVPGGFEMPCSKKTNCPRIAFFDDGGSHVAVISEDGGPALFESDEQLDALEALLTARRLAR